VARKALCVGINDYPSDGSDLNGCVNDAKAWAGLLVEHFDFGKGNLRMLLDREATRASIMQSLGERTSPTPTGTRTLTTRRSALAIVKRT
jgi:hypothetical protein